MNVSKPWYKRDSGLFDELKQQIEDEYPDLKFRAEGLNVYLGGFFPLYEGDKVYDRYHIEIKLSHKSPTDLPIVREIDGRIPHEPNRHINPKDGTACIVLPDSYWNKYPSGMSLVDFLNGPVQNFFASQSLLESGAPKPWIDGEWRHGSLGIIDFYSEILGTKNPKEIYQYLRALKSPIVKGHWICPCGSGKKIRDCHHWAFIEELRTRIPRSVAAESVKSLWRDMLNNNNPNFYKNF